MVFLWGTIKTLNFIHLSVCALNGSPFIGVQLGFCLGGDGERVCEYPQSHLKYIVLAN